MKKILEFPNCVIATTADKFTSLLAPNPPLQQWMDGVCFEDHRAENMPQAPGVYRATVEVWFEQGYSDGYPADGESDWELRLANVQPVAIENFEPDTGIECQPERNRIASLSVE